MYLCSIATLVRNRADATAKGAADATAKGDAGTDNCIPDSTADSMTDTARNKSIEELNMFLNATAKGDAGYL